jgi:hypothetical protein
MTEHQAAAVFRRAEAETAVTRERVLAYPDLAGRLTRPPLNFKRPEQWNGYVPPRLDADDRANRYPGGPPSPRSSPKHSNATFLERGPERGHVTKPGGVSLPGGRDGGLTLGVVNGPSGRGASCSAGLIELLGAGPGNHGSPPWGRLDDRIEGW